MLEQESKYKTLVNGLIHKLPVNILNMSVKKLIDDYNCDVDLALQDIANKKVNHENNLLSNMTDQLRCMDSRLPLKENCPDL